MNGIADVDMFKSSHFENLRIVFVSEKYDGCEVYILDFLSQNWGIELIQTEQIHANLPARFYRYAGVKYPAIARPVHIHVLPQDCVSSLGLKQQPFAVFCNGKLGAVRH